MTMAETAQAIFSPEQQRGTMNSIIYLIGLIVVVLAILSFIGLA